MSPTYHRRRDASYVHPDLLEPVPRGHSLIASSIYPTLGILLSAAFEERRLKVFVIATAVLLALVAGPASTTHRGRP